MAKTIEETIIQCASVRVNKNRYKGVEVTVEDALWQEFFYQPAPIEWLSKNYDPADIFEEGKLADWAERNGYTKTQEQ